MAKDQYPAFLYLVVLTYDTFFNRRMLSFISSLFYMSVFFQDNQGTRSLLSKGFFLILGNAYSMLQRCHNNNPSLLGLTECPWRL